MTASAVDLLGDTSRPVAERVDAAARVGDLLAAVWPLGVAWQTLCHVIFDDTDDIAVRAAAIRALANAPAAAPNQLVRMFGADPDRALRKQALGVLRSLNVAPQITAG